MIQWVMTGILLAAGVGDTDRETLEREVLLEQGDVQPLVDQLSARIEDETLGDEELREARHTLGWLLRRRGDLRPALSQYRFLVDEDATDREALTAMAELLDAVGRNDDAAQAYQILLGHDLEDAERDRIQLRLAMIELLGDDPDGQGLMEYVAGRGDPEAGNRAAIVLALQGRPRAAIDLFRVDWEDEKVFRQEVRIASWALRGEQPEKAQEWAWRAMMDARLKRDRHYALAVLVEAHRADDSLDALIEKFAGTPDLPAAARTRWIELLRSQGRVDEALELYDTQDGGDFTPEMRRELLRMYEEAGRDQEMVALFQERITQEPDEVLWLEGLSRHHLERGDRDSALQVWTAFLATPGHERTWLWAAESLASLGLDELAFQCCETYLAEGAEAAAPLLFAFSLHRQRGDMEQAEATLERLDLLAPPEAAARMQLAEAFEQIGRIPRAIQVLEAVRDARPVGEVGEDLEMRLNWLLSEVGEEERALEGWLSLWRRIDSIPRRRYVEDRMMTVASRLGRLADLAIELELKLAAGEADSHDSGLLVRLYTKVNDPVSAAEVIEEFLRHAGGSTVKALQEKARVYVACTDYHHYEKTVRELIEVDPEGRGDYLRQLAMSQLERGKPDEARDVLMQLKDGDDASDSSEFEAGVLSLAGLREEAVAAYRKGLARAPGRIDSTLLMANLMKGMGQTDRAVGMFQYLAETADKDDLFTIAIDGLLNMEAPPSVLAWARRITLERLAGRHDKMYLYQLLSDLSEELQDREGMRVALENSLAIAGERRPSLLRELMDLCGAQSPFPGGPRGVPAEPALQLSYGRRLIGLDEVVPPQVYLDLGEAFLRDNDVESAARTLALARDLPDEDQFQRQCADLFEGAAFLEQALTTYARVLVTHPTDVPLLTKVGELHEQLGRDQRAREYYVRAMDLLMARRPRVSTQVEEQTDPYSYLFARNVDEYDQYQGRVLQGLLVTTSPGAVLDGYLSDLGAALDQDLADVDDLAAAEQMESLRGENFPRLMARLGLFRRMAQAFGRVDLADARDLALLQRFGEDDTLLEGLVQARVAAGMHDSGKRLVEGSGHAGAAVDRARWQLGMVGTGSDGNSALRPIAEVTRLVLPLFLAGRAEEVKSSLRLVDYAGVEQAHLSEVGVVFAASQYVGDADLLLQVCRQWVRLHIKHGTRYYELEQLLDRLLSSLDEERSLSLAQYCVGLVLDDPAKGADYLPLLPGLVNRFDEPLVEAESLLTMIEEYQGPNVYSLSPVLWLLPAEDQPGALRMIWPSLQNTLKYSFLTQLLNQAQDDLPEPMANLVLEKFEEAIRGPDELQPYMLENLANTSHSKDLVRRMAEVVMEHEPDMAAAKALVAIHKHKDGDVEEAVVLLKEAWPGLCKTENDYYERRFREHLMEEFLPDQVDAVLACVAQQTEGGDPAMAATQRLELLGRLDDPQRLATEMERMQQDHRDNRGVMQQVLNWHRRQGRTQDAIGVLESMVEQWPEDKALRRQLVDTWRGRQHPVKALEVAKLGEIETDAERQANRYPPGAIIIQGGVATIASSLTMTGGAKGGPEWPAGKARPASIQGVKDAMEKDDLGQASNLLRRLWRQYVSSDPRLGRVIYNVGGPARTMAWPADRKPETDETPKEEVRRERYLGGLVGFREEPSKPAAPRPGAWEVLAGHEFGLAELERRVRSSDARMLDSLQDILEAVVLGRVQRQGAEAVRDELKQALASGQARKVEHALLLALLDKHPELVDEELKGRLADLLRSLRPQDGPQLLRLARTMANQGQTEEAVNLLRWCATQAQSMYSYRLEDGPTLDVAQLVQETKEILEGEDRLRVVEAILGFADPGDNWYRENFEALVLQTWTDLVGSKDALARCEDACEGVLDFQKGLRRQPARWAAAIFAHNDRTDLAVRCLEVALCKMDKSLFDAEDLSAQNQAKHPGYVSDDDLRRLFPRDTEEWPGARDWYVAAGTAVSGWMEEGRMREGLGARILCLLVRRLAVLQDTETMQTILDTLARNEEEVKHAPLWVLDAFREAGQEDEAQRREQELLEKDLLTPNRVIDLLERWIAAGQAEEALRLGTEVTARMGPEDLYLALAQASEALGDADGAARWTAAAAESKAAAEELTSLLKGE